MTWRRNDSSTVYLLTGSLIRPACWLISARTQISELTFDNPNRVRRAAARAGRAVTHIFWCTVSVWIFCKVAYPYHAYNRQSSLVYKYLPLCNVNNWWEWEWGPVIEAAQAQQLLMCQVCAWLRQESKWTHKWRQATLHWHRLKPQNRETVISDRDPPQNKLIFRY